MKFERIVIAGADLVEQLRTEKEAKVSKTPYGFNSEQLCEWQRKVAGRGIVEIEIVESLYGFSVRYASGLNNFGLILPARGRADPSLEYAEQFCRDWVAVDPARRYATRTVTLALAEGEA